MPKALAEFMGYTFFFFSNEGTEPMHIHVCKGSDRNNAAKFWIKRDGIAMEHNNAKIPANDLKKIKKYIVANRSDIIVAWTEYFVLGE